MIDITPTIAACASPVAMIAARAGPRRMSWLRGRGGGGSGIGSRAGYQRLRSEATARGSGRNPTISQMHRAPSAGTSRNGPAPRSRPADPATDSAAIASSGPVTAPIAPAVATVPTPRPRSTGGYRSAAAARPSSAGPWPQPKIGGADDEQREAAGPDREAAQERADAEQAQTGQDHRLAPRWEAMLPTTNSEIMLNANARPTLRPARPSCPGELLRGDGAHGRVERNRCARRRPGSPPGAMSSARSRAGR